MEFSNDGKETRDTTVRVHIQSDAAVKSYGVLAFGYNSANEHLQINYVKVIKPDGKVVKTPAANIQDVTSAITRAAPMYTDYREKHVAVEGLGIGDEVEYSTQVSTIKPLVPGQFWFDFDFVRTEIALHEELQVSFPAKRKVIVKSPNLKPVISEHDGRRIYTWETANLKDETSQNVRASYLPPPSIEVTSFRSWAQVGAWWGQLERKEATPTPAIQAEALKLTKGDTTDEQKIHSIYKYVSEQFRYISISFGIGRYQPHAAAAVLRNEYGDCKDKHTLLASLLQAVGVRVFPALVSATNKIDPEVPSPGQFDHVIGYIPIGQKALWLDTTAEVAAEGFLVPNLLNKSALIIPDGKPAYLGRTPSAEPFQSYVLFTADGKLSADGTFTGTIHRTARGYTGLAFRLVFRSTRQDKWEELTQGISRITGFGGTVSNVTASSTEDIDHPFRFSYTYVRKNYGDWPARKIVPALPPFGMPSVKKGKDQSGKPIYFTSATNFVFTSKITLPKGYTPQLPKTVDVKFDFADYHSTYTFKNGVLTAERTLSLKTREVPAASRKDYLKLQDAVRADEDQFIQLNQEQASAQPPVNPQAVKLFNRAMQALQIQDAGSAQDFLQQALKLDPTFERAWFMEGALHESRGEFEEGFADLRKAIALNPKDASAYGSLVRGLLVQRRRKEAIQVLKDLLKQDPNVIRARVQLGSLLLDNKEYRKAVPQFQAALAVDKGNPLMESSLGRAYAGIGKSTEAAEAFKMATAADPTPRVWTIAANSLAKLDQELPEAQHYAELAVKADEAKSAKLTIADAGSNDLLLMKSLASDWDMLGWVYFNEKNLMEARKYLGAAWNLNQSETIGDHLGQFYEKLGDRQEAIKIYASGAASSDLASSDARSRLSRLLKNRVDRVEAALHQASFGNSHSLKVRLSKNSKVTGYADFLILFSAGPKVVGLKFTSGDHRLKAASRTIASSHFHILFPDGSHTRILRKGALVCLGAALGCNFTLTPLDLSPDYPTRQFGNRRSY